MLLRFFLLATFCFHLTIRGFNIMNSTKLVFKNWFHFNFYYYYYYYCYFLPLGISFAHKRIVCCLRCLEPSEKGGFSPTPCTSPLRDLPNSLCLCGLPDLWLCCSQKGLYQGRTGITRILFQVSWGFSWCTACVSRWSNPVAVGCAVTPFQGRGKRLVQCQCSSLDDVHRRSTPSADVDPQEFCDKALVGITPSLPNPALKCSVTEESLPLTPAYRKKNFMLKQSEKWRGDNLFEISDLSGRW